MLALPGRYITLAGASLAALSSGTLYLASSYAPQVAAKLHLSSKATNLFLLCANTSTYLSSPFVGLIVDKKGGRIVMLCAALALFAGYALLKLSYDAGDEGGLKARFGALPVLALGETLVGLGSSASYAGFSNGVAKTFDSKRRATALSVCISCLGLSAFAYSSLALLIPDRGDPTSSFLALLALGCGGSILIAAFLIRPPLHHRHHHSQTLYSPVPNVDVMEREASPRGRATLSPSPSPSSEETSDGSSISSGEEMVVEVEYVRAKSRERAESKARAIAKEALGHPNVGGWALLRELDFALLFLFMGILAGCGLMFINNVGTLVHSLPLPPTTPNDPTTASLSLTAIQQRLVSLLSIFNSLGRLLCGPLTDYLSTPSTTKRWTKRWTIPRVWFLCPVAALFIFVNATVARTESVEILQGTAILMGLAYGSLCGSMPVYVIEWFGLASFSTNNGWLSISPAIFGNVFNVLFGTLYDIQAGASPTPSPPLPSPSQAIDLVRRGGLPSTDHLCTLGNACFRSAFQLTTTLAVGALGLAVWMGMRRGRG
ncbi:major facilitator superfamily domain-containing protein [Leucosporidium creatinivorum]|uniref:Major facilitator superfamily domain-containing protein n=1 Tax=Leucosporidium creatinivorum TaxID=106004 RepID=A0A1Y2F746_9BASI|nr:major facilitator superfamily domain-containing protein [Leucosporidium creatinivorum]